ncbi:SDR family NAD(P)-dependent oxidoreductase [Alkalicoccus daliensis]|uniref:3-oxoacyl-[acyl-carrier protein] reductase n=1 Tax=Alkalicoccus daliensis TaxID=745820 RepID=A0A1H0EXQ0_9BACI|nr:SDR family NAD(P)-dependent oxidoreductase [Alkalicoccus daliensis]SDN87125.1 3-oxoacyl-[acyl-carrier protein] reductase [Alkalicoccus daliensis]
MNKEPLLENKTAIVTGASRGIGRAIAVTLANHGASVIINGRDADTLNEVAKEIEETGSKCFIVTGDAADPKTAKKVIQCTLDTFQKIDILVNNAGINMRSSTLDMSIAEWKKVIDINLNASLYFCQAALPHMVKAQSGKIINMSSKASKTPHQNASPAYGASKAAINYLTMHLANEFAQDNIYVNGVCPGPVETEMTQQWTEEYRARALAGIPLNRLGTPQNIADSVLYLASSLSDFVTGETININGGSFMN